MEDFPYVGGGNGKFHIIRFLVFFLKCFLVFFWKASLSIVSLPKLKATLKWLYFQKGDNSKMKWFQVAPTTINRTWKLELWNNKSNCEYNVDTVNNIKNNPIMEEEWQTFFHLLFLLFGIITIIGNAIILSVIISNRKLRRVVSNSFIFSLSIADFCVGLFVMIPAWLKSVVSVVFIFLSRHILFSLICNSKNSLCFYYNSLFFSNWNPSANT